MRSSFDDIHDGISRRRSRMKRRVKEEQDEEEVEEDNDHRLGGSLTHRVLVISFKC